MKDTEFVPSVMVVGNSDLAETLKLRCPSTLNVPTTDEALLVLAKLRMTSIVIPPDRINGGHSSINFVNQAKALCPAADIIIATFGLVDEIDQDLQRITAMSFELPTALVPLGNWVTCPPEYVTE